MADSVDQERVDVLEVWFVRAWNSRRILGISVVVVQRYSDRLEALRAQVARNSVCERGLSRRRGTRDEDNLRLRSGVGCDLAYLLFVVKLCERNCVSELFRIRDQLVNGCDRAEPDLVSLLGVYV